MTTVAEELDMLNVNEEGYLYDPAEWSEDVARMLAADEDIDLTDEHWRVLRFMRDYHAEHGIAADARFVIRFIAEELGYKDLARTRLFELFPYGYVKQACKIAGMQRPRAWSTG